MNAIKVQKASLLDKLKANRETHRAQFEEAAKLYRDEVIEVLEERIKDARKGRLPNLVFQLPLPVNQTAAYDRAIGMLEMSVDDVIELEEEDYRQYVLDEWTWSQHATISNSYYTSKKK